MGTMSYTEICNLDNGHGAQRIIPGARFAVVAGDMEHPGCVVSTHRSLDSAERVVRSSGQFESPLAIVAIV